jgi:hypothetical protein
MGEDHAGDERQPTEDELTDLLGDIHAAGHPVEQAS